MWYITWLNGLKKVFITKYILNFYLKLIFFILISVLFLYVFIVKETAYYYCDEVCITIIQHHKGRDAFLEFMMAL